MLKKITCDKFKTQPEEFRNGLNVILGSSGGSNAIGKSTFLLILDFAFGGDSYTKTAKDVIAHVEHHTINIEFEFDGDPFYYSRSTSRPSTVNRCDSKYHVIKEMSVADYREELKHEYRILLQDITFGSIVERFIRIYGQGNHNEHKPMQESGESMATAVDNLMKLLGDYEPLHNLKTAEENYGVKPGKQNERLISDISAAIADNNSEIEGLEKRREKLCRQNEEADLRALGINPEQAEQLAEVKKEMEKLSRRKGRLLTQLNALRNNMQGDVTQRNDFSALLRFFPAAKISTFSDIEAFHAKINGFLRVDIEAEMEKLQPQIDIVDEQINEYETQIKESGVAKSLSQSILTQYASTTRKIEKLEEDNERLNEEIIQSEKRKEMEKLLASLRRKQESALAEAAATINTEMTAINAVVTGGDRPSPELILKPDKTFEFETKDDKSEGTAFKNLVVYDLSMLNLTVAPILIHDSSIVKRIEDADFEQILELYQASGSKGKQVFIAFDKADSYTEKTCSALERTTRLHLSVGDELFGTSWSRQAPTSDTKPSAAAEISTEKADEDK